MVYQERFLGSSIRNYSASIGWNEQPSELKVGLVDDDKVGDQFLGYPFYNGPGEYYPGNYAIFSHQGTFNFGGIIQSIERTRSAEGDPLYEVTMRDPRFILEGVQLITNDYAGSVLGLTNIFNLYGLYGGLGSNESGMSWIDVVAGLSSLLNTPNLTYGSYVNYRGVDYGVYIQDLPPLPYDYRVGGSGHISLMDFIQEICDAGGCDWFCNLEIREGYTNPLIIIYTIRRDAFLLSGAIEQFTENVDGAVSTNSGIELIDSVCNKLLVGGNREDVWFTSAIQPYWGTKQNGDIIEGSGIGDDHQMYLDASTWTVYGISDTYHTDVAELRAALENQESWETFLWFRNTSNTPQAGRAYALGIVSDINYDILNIIQNTPPGQLSTLQLANLKAQSINNTNDYDANKNRKNLYDLIKSFATDYFGKKFHVAIPSVYTLGSGKPTREIVESAYIEESIGNSLVGNGYVPSDVLMFTTNEGKLTAYVRFDAAETYDFSEIGDDDKYVQYNAGFGNYSVFVKCQVDESPVFYDNDMQLWPRAVITLPGVVREVTPGVKDNVAVFYDFLQSNSVPSATINSLIGGLGGDILTYGREAMAVQPAMAAVPMRSNIECYGPWWGGTQYNGIPIKGKVEYEKDDSLTPWNYGGYSNMSLAGYAKVNGVVSNQPWSETGHVEFPGVPQQNLGGALIAGGPYVSDIACSVGEDGAKTTYRLNRYTPSFGRLTRYNVDKLAKVGKAWQQHRRGIRMLMATRNKIATINQTKQNFFKALKAKRDRSNSSHHLICGQLRGYKYDVVSQPVYNAMTQLSDSYTDKGGMSLDGIFRPYSTDINTANLPHFEEPSATAEGPTVTDLHPYQNGHDIQCVVHGDSVPEDLVFENVGAFPSEDSYRPMALKGPIVICGWGYDTNGKPVPNAEPDEPGDEFLNGYLQRSEMWKCGPLDARWDGERKVWVTGGESVKVVKALDTEITEPDESPHTIDYRKVYECRIYNVVFDDDAPGGDVTLEATDEYIYAANFRSLVVLTNRYYLAHKISGKWVLDVQSDFTDE